MEQLRAAAVAAATCSAVLPRPLGGCRNDKQQLFAYSVSLFVGASHQRHFLACRFLFALDRLSSRHRSTVAELRLQVVGSLARCSSLLKSVALKILARLASADPEALWSEVTPQLPALLGRPPVSVQNGALQLCKQLMQTANLSAQQACAHSPSSCSHHALYMSASIMSAHV